jgi:hypothetical protein
MATSMYLMHWAVLQSLVQHKSQRGVSRVEKVLSPFAAEHKIAPLKHICSILVNH